jgi:hypothetical protein
MEIITKLYNNFEVSFSTDIDTNLYLNATKVAKQFGKKPDDWLRTKQTQDYIKALLSRFVNMRNGDLVVVKQGGNDKKAQGTWIHKKLIIAFARWLSPDFAVWCDSVIEEILKGEVQISKPEKRTDLISVSKEELDLELQALKFILDNVSLSEKEKISCINQTLEKINFQTLENPHLIKNEPVFSLTDLLKEFEISETAHQFNLKLESFGIIERQENGWQIVNMKYGRNLPASFGNNPKYFKSTFQELLDL